MCVVLSPIQSRGHKETLAPRPPDASRSITFSRQTQNIKKKNRVEQSE